MGKSNCRQWGAEIVAEQHEFHRTAGQLFESLSAHRKIRFVKRPRVGVGDELDWAKGVASYRASISKQIKKLLPDSAVRDDFAALCYQDETSQDWLRGC